MKRTLLAATIVAMASASGVFAQSKIKVPTVVKEQLAKEYPTAKNVTWEREKGNYEANWGGKSGEDNSVIYSPSGKFVEAGRAIPASELPTPAMSYVKAHYKGASISEVMKVTDAAGRVTYEAEVSGKDILFDEHGNFVKTEKE